LALVALGMVVRVVRYLANRSLWLDEAYLAESILTYSFRQLLTQELLHWQAAPVGFLLLEKLAVTGFGTSEYALRLVPLIAGLASVPLFHAVARRALRPAGALVALAMFATLEPLVYYSAEVKQYGLDVAAALLIVWLAQRLLDRPQSGARLAALGVVGAVAMFLSHPAVFVLAAAGLVSFGELCRRGSRRQAVALALVVCAWIGAGALNYLVFLRPLTNHRGLIAYWSAGYMPLDAGAVPWLGVSLYRAFSDYSTMWLPLPDVAVLAAVIGLACLWRRDRRTLGLLLIPVALALAASALRRFPFSGRVILFVVPLMTLLIGAGAQAVIEAVRPGRRLVPAAFLLLLLGPTVGRAVFFALRPPGREEIKHVLAHVRDHKRPGDVLYVFNLSQVPFGYYRDRYGLDADRFGLAGLEHVIGREVAPATEAAFAGELAPLRGRGRVWVLLTHTGALGGPDEGTIVPAVLDRWGTRLDARSAKGARVMLYDLSGPPGSGASAPTRPSLTGATPPAHRP
jgi:hypothetical protein